MAGGRKRVAAGTVRKVAGKDTKVKLKTGTETVKFDKAASARKRASSAAKKKRIDTTAKTQRVSGRAKSRAGTQAKVHGRTDAQKLKSKAVGKRNVRYAAETLATVAPGGAAASYAAKAKKIGKAAKYAAAAGKGSLKKGAKRIAQSTAKKVSKQGLKKSAVVAGRGAKAVGKYVAKDKTKAKINKSVRNVATT